MSIFSIAKLIKKMPFIKNLSNEIIISKSKLFYHSSENQILNIRSIDCIAWNHALCRDITEIDGRKSQLAAKMRSEKWCCLWQSLQPRPLAPSEQIATEAATCTLACIVIADAVVSVFHFRDISIIVSWDWDANKKYTIKNFWPFY